MEFAGLGGNREEECRARNAERQRQMRVNRCEEANPRRAGNPGRHYSNHALDLWRWKIGEMKGTNVGAQTGWKRADDTG